MIYRYLYLLFNTSYITVFIEGGSHSNPLQQENNLFLLQQAIYKNIYLRLVLVRHVGTNPILHIYIVVH